MWNCLDRVSVSNTLLAYISGSVHSTADFLSRMQQDPSLSPKTKHTTHMSICEIETEAKASDAFLSDNVEVTQSSNGLPIGDNE